VWTLKTLRDGRPKGSTNWCIYIDEKCKVILSVSECSSRVSSSDIQVREYSGHHKSQYTNRSNYYQFVEGAAALEKGKRWKEATVLKPWTVGMTDLMASYFITNSVVIRRLTTGIPSDKCVVWRFRRCANVPEYTYTNLDGTAYYTLKAIHYSLLLLGYKPVQHVTVLNTVGNCNTVVSIVIL
jgi:hypothetical protein